MAEANPTDFIRRRLSTPRLLGAAIAFLGGTVIISWYLYSLELVTVPAQWVAMQYNTAVGFVFTGLAVVAQCMGRRRLGFLCGAVAAGIGSIALAELLLGREFRFLDIFFQGSPVTGSAGRMAPNTALCFSLAGCLTVVFSLPRHVRWREMAITVLAALVAAAGFVGLLGYVMVVDHSGSSWARFTRMDLHVALAFLGLGVAFFAMLGHFRRNADARLPLWAPWGAGIGVAALIITMWVGLTSSERRMQSIATTKAHEAVTSHANRTLQAQLDNLERLADVFGNLVQGAPDDLDRNVKILVSDEPGLVSLVFVNNRGIPTYSNGPGTVNGPWVEQLLERPAVQHLVERSRREGIISATDPMPVSDRVDGLFVCVPVEHRERGIGQLVFQYTAQAFFNGVFAEGVLRAFDMEITTPTGGLVYSSFDAYRAPRKQLASNAAGQRSRGQIAFADRIWNVRGTTDALLLADGRDVGNALILWVGIFLAVAIAFGVRKTELLRERADSLVRANQIIEHNAQSLVLANTNLERQAEELRGTEERLRRAAREKRRILDSLSAFLIGIDGDGKVIEWNYVSSELFGLSSNETLGLPFDELSVPWDAEVVRGFMNEALATGERVRCDNLPVSCPGQDPRVVSFTINPAQDGKRRGLAFIGSDVTERQMLEVQLHNAQKLESVGTLAAGIAHEINTPMQFVGDNVRFMAQSVGPITTALRLMDRLEETVREGKADPELADEVAGAMAHVDVDFIAEELPMAVDESLEGIDRVTTIVRAMKDFSHQGNTTCAAADLNQAIETTLAVARNEYKYYVDVETDYGDIPPVECWIADLNQVFLNLLVNATHAIRDKLGEASGERGRIGISTRLDEDMVEIRFTDTGGGIPEEIRAKIFDQFYTTKEIGKGTGLGLSIARAVVVDTHSGTLDFESVVGEGTTFVVRIPLRQEVLDAETPSHEFHPVC